MSSNTISIARIRNLGSASVLQPPANSSLNPSARATAGTLSSGLPIHISQSQGFRPSYSFDPKPGMDDIGNIVGGWVNSKLNESSRMWGVKFFDAVEKVQIAEGIYTRNLEKLDSLLQQTPSSDIEENLAYQREIETATHDLSLSATDLYHCITKAQHMRHKFKPFVLNRDTGVERAIQKVNDKYLKPLKDTWIPRCRVFVDQVEKQNKRAINWDVAHLHFCKQWPEFSKLYTEIFMPHKSDEERAILLEQLRGVRNSTSLAAEEVLASSKGNQNRTTNFSLSPEQIKEFQEIAGKAEQNFEVAFQEAAFYARSETDNIQEINNLRQQGQNAEYLHKSSLLASKLLRDKRIGACVDFAVEWMQNSGSNIPPSAVLQMGHVFVEAWQNQRKEMEDEHPNILDFKSLRHEDFYKSFNIWRKDHPNLCVTPEILTSKKPKDSLTEAEQLELLQGFLASLQGRDPTFDEMQCFLNCDQIDPSPYWKNKQGEYYISTLQWDETRRVISKLSDENALVLKQSLSWSQFQVACSVLDLAAFILQLTAQSTAEGRHRPILQGVNVVVQTAMYPSLAKQWLPGLVSDYPTELQEHPDFIKDSGTPLDIFYFARTVIPTMYPFVDRYATIRTQEAFNQYVKPGFAAIIDGSAVTMGAITFLNPKLPEAFAKDWGTAASNVVSLVIQVGTSTTSLICFANRTLNHRASPTWRAVENMASKATSVLTPLHLFHRAAKVTAWLGRKYIPQFFGATISLPATIAFTVIQVGVIAGQVGFQFCPIKTACFLEDVYEHWMGGDYEKGEALLKAAKDWWFINHALADEYLKCKSFFELYPLLQEDETSKNTLIERIKNLDVILIKLKQSGAYESLSHHLIYTKVSAYLRCGEIVRAVQTVSSEKMASSFGASIANLLVTQGISLMDQKRYKTAEKYLEEFIGLTNLKDYKSLLESHKKHISARRTQNSSPEVSDARIDLLVGPLDQAIQETQGNPYLLETGLNLNFEKLSLYLQFKKYDQVNLILINKNVSSRIYARLADHLIQSTYHMGQIDGYERSHEYLKEMNQYLKYGKYQVLMDQVLGYLALRAKHPNLSPNEQERVLFMKAIDDLLSSLKSHLPYLEPNLQLEKVIVLVHAAHFSEANTIMKQQKSVIHDKLALYFFKHVEPLLQQGRYELALNYLNSVASLEFNHNLLISKYKDLLDLHKKYKEAIPASQEDAKKFIAAIDTVLSLLPNTENFMSIALSLKKGKLFALMNIEEYESVKVIISQENMAVHLGLDLMTDLISKAEALRNERDIDGSERYIRGVLTKLSLPENRLMKRYRSFLSALEAIPSTEKMEDDSSILNVVILIDSLLTDLKNVPLSLRATQANLYIQLAQFYQRKHNFPKAITSFTSALNSLPPGNEKVAEALEQNIKTLENIVLIKKAS